MNQLSDRERANRLSNLVIGAAMEVHRALGPGLLESVYEECLCHELNRREIPYIRQAALPLLYKGIDLECGFRLDIMVDDLLIVELKSVEKIEPIHQAQLLTYLRLARKWLGLLINFNVPLLRDGIHRLVNG
jgi:GxxExxY protein